MLELGKPLRPVLSAFLVHGMGRTPVSLALLAHRLRREGVRPYLFGYSATIESFSAIAGRLQRFITTRISGPWVAVGHSLGGLLLREAIGRSLPAVWPRHLITLGTPQRPSRLAKSMRTRRYYRAIHGDCGQLLADEARMAALPLLSLPIITIAGTLGWYGRWSPFGDEPNDGVVAVSETWLEGAQSIQLRLLHTFMMNSRQVACIVLSSCEV